MQDFRNLKVWQKAHALAMDVYRVAGALAMGSASETGYHLLVARDLGLIRNDIYDELSTRTSEVRRMLTGLIKRLSPPPAPMVARRALPRAH